MEKATKATHTLYDWKGIVFEHTSYNYSDRELELEYGRGSCAYDVADEGDSLLDEALFGDGISSWAD